MNKEQPGLFGDVLPSGFEEVRQPPKTEFQTFLPGLKQGEGFNHITEWSELASLVSECRLCSLREGCRQVVFGEGNRNADIMLVGEGPGQVEDEMGRPFVGPAGQLLDKILAAAGMTRQGVYITNVVKCRPPGNRLPNLQEIMVCRGYLEAQIRLIEPRILISLGALATQTLVAPGAKVTEVRGKWFTRQGIMIMPTFHPAALLRNEKMKRPVWEDFKLIREEMVKKGLKT